jgi:hypothetical protein
MFRVLLASTHMQLRVVVALLSWFLTGIATAADDPKDPQPDVSAAQAARHEPPPVSYNSVAPRKFEADPKKVTMEVLPGGARLYHMNGQGMQAITAHLGASGKVEYTCSDRSEQAANSAATSANAHEQ